MGNDITFWIVPLNFQSLRVVHETMLYNTFWQLTLLGSGKIFVYTNVSLLYNPGHLKIKLLSYQYGISLLRWDGLTTV